MNASNISRLLCASALLMIGTRDLQGQPAHQDSLATYLEWAVKNNPTVIQRFYEYQAALKKVPQVGSLPDPVLNLGVFLTPMELVEGRQVADIRVMQMFPWFGSLRAAKDEMSLMAMAKYESIIDSKLQVAYDAQRTWDDLYKINADIRISGKNLEILQILERLATARFGTASFEGSAPGSQQMNSGTGSLSGASSSGKSGMQGMGTDRGDFTPGTSTPSSPAMPGSSMSQSSGSTGLPDLYRIQIEIGDLKNNIALLENEKKVTTAKFNSYLNRSMLTPVMADTLVMDTLDIPLQTVLDSMLNQNPMLSMIRYEQQSLQARRKMAARMGMPMVGLGIDYSLINKTSTSDSPMNGKDMIMPMLSISLPIYRNKYKASQTEAVLLSDASGQNYAAVANELKTEYYQALQLYEDAFRRIKLYSGQADLSKKTLDIMLKSYATSSSTSLSDLLRIYQQNLDYEFKQVEANADYHSGISWLKRLMAYSKTN